jgi:hypothetical protein
MICTTEKESVKSDDQHVVNIRHLPEKQYRRSE